MPFDSCKQDLSFGVCYFSVPHLVPEILAQTWRHVRFSRGLNKMLQLRSGRVKTGITFCYILSNISGTKKDTENLRIPNERYCLQLSNDGLYVSVALIVLMVYLRKRGGAILQKLTLTFLKGISSKP